MEEKTMKKLLAILLALAMMFSLVACGEKEENQDNNGNEGNDTPVVETPAGETFNVGAFSVYVPGGWKAFPVADVFAEEPDAVDPEVIEICKGGEAQTDIYSKPYVRLSYYDPDTIMGRDKSFYEDVKDLDPVVAGNFTWEAFSCTSFGYPMTILWMADGDHEYQAIVYTDQADGTISVNDADVLEILASVQPAG